MGILTEEWLGLALRRQRAIIRFDQPEVYATQATVMSWFENGGSPYGGILMLKYDNIGDYHPVTAHLFGPGELAGVAWYYTKRWPQGWKRDGEIVCTRATAQGWENIPATNALVLQSLTRMEGMARAQGRTEGNPRAKALLWYTSVRLSAAVSQLNEERARIVGAQG